MKRTFENERNYQPPRQKEKMVEKHVFFLYRCAGKNHFWPYAMNQGEPYPGPEGPFLFFNGMLGKYAPPPNARCVCGMYRYDYQEGDEDWLQWQRFFNNNKKTTEIRTIKSAAQPPESFTLDEAWGAVLSQSKK